MRAAVILFALSTITGCGLMPAETVFIGDDRPENDRQVARVCGDESNIFAIFWYDEITANVISVDGRLIPAFERDRRNVFGERIVPSLQGYCLEIPAGEHELTLLAERLRGVGMAGSLEYHLGVCDVVTEGGDVYITMPVRSPGNWPVITIHLKEENKDEPTTVCQMEIVPEEQVLELLDHLTGETK